MNKQMQTQSSHLRGRMFRQDSAKPKEKRILVLKTGIAGAYFHIENEDERIALESIEPGTELMLYREPENEYDEWAVAVYLNEEDKLGFISRFKNETIARLMDAGKKFIAVTDEPVEMTEENFIDYKGGKPGQKYAPTEGVSDLAFSVYLVEEE